MSFQKDIIEAEVRTAGAHKVQADLGKVNKRIAELAATNKRLKYEMAKLEAQGKKNSPAWKELNNQHKINNKLLTIQRGKLEELNSKLKLTEMSKKQLRKRSIELGAALSNTSKKLEPEKWNKLNNQLIATEKQLDKVKHGSKQSMSVMTGLKRVAVNILPAAGIATFVQGIKNLAVDLFNLTKVMQGDAVRSATVLGDSYGYVANQAEKMAAKMGLTEREFIANTAAAADLLVPLGFQRDVAAEMAVELQSLVGPLDEWTGGQIGATEVSNILTKALLGENEQLKQLGIAIKMDSKEFTDLVKQYQAREGVTKAQAQAMAELELITRKSADAQTAYAGSGNKLLRMQKSISRWWKQLKEDVVTYLTVSDHDRLMKSVDAFKKMESQFASEQKTLSSLLSTYDSLQSKGQLTKDEQLKLNEAIKQIGAIVPGAITEFNKYGEAIGINKDLIEQAREAQRLLNLEMKKDTITDLVESIEDHPEEISRLEYNIRRLTDSIQEKVKAGVGEGWYTQSEIKRRAEEIQQRNELNNEIAETILKLKALGLTDEEVSQKTGYAVSEITQRLKDYVSTSKSTEDATAAVRNLIKEQEIYARNQKIQTIEKEIKRLSELGTAQDNLDKFITKSNEEQVAAIKEYFKGVGADAYEGFKKAYEDAASQEPLNLLPVEEEEEENTDDPDTNYEIQQFMQTLEYKEELLKLQRDNGIIGEKEYQAEIDKINQKHEEKRYKQKMAYNQKAQQMAQFGANFVNALMQMELEAAGDNEEKKKEIRKKYAVMNFMTSASGIIVNTAGAVMKALEQLGPIAGPIAAGIIGATGAVQLGIAYTEMQKVRGMEEGGFTKVRRAQDNKEFRARYQPNRRGFIDKPTVLVSEKDPEFVANGGAVKNPSVKPYLDVIDAAQRAGTIETLNLPAVMNSMAVEGRESGGYTNTNSSDDIEFDPQDSYNDQINQLLSKLNLSIDELNEILSSPILAKISYFEILAKFNEAEKIKNRS